jgi:hypothetical protein
MTGGNKVVGRETGTCSSHGLDEDLEVAKINSIIGSEAYFTQGCAESWVATNYVASNAQKILGKVTAC